MTNSKSKYSLAIGLMSGTSLDGVDAALIKVEGGKTDSFGRAVFLPYHDDDKIIFKSALKEAALLKKICQNNPIINDAETRITALHIEAILILLAKNNLQAGDIKVVGFHGQTILHMPDKALTWQIGLGGLLAKTIKIPVVNDFRTFDVLNGGQGAPLVPIYHLALMNSLKNPIYPAAVLNLGGVGNVTYISGAEPEEMIAFDTGAGNALLDDYVSLNGRGDMDVDGAFSASGRVNEKLLTRWLSHPFFTLKAPKSLDRNSFNLTGLDEMLFEDSAATIAAFTCHSVKIAEGLFPEIPAVWYVTGGGRHNKFMMSLLQNLLEGRVKKIEEINGCGDRLEAEAFAYLALLILEERPISFPKTTGIDQNAYKHKKGQTGRYYPI